MRHVLIEDLGLETEIGGVLVEMLVVESALMIEEVVVHLPEPALARRGLGRFRRMLGMGVDLAQGKVARSYELWTWSWSKGMVFSTSTGLVVICT